MCFGMGCQYENKQSGECEKPANASYPCETVSAEEWENTEELPDMEDLQDV